MRARTIEFERRSGHGDRLDQLGTVIEGVHQPRDAGAGVEFAAHEAEAAHRVPVERRHRAPSKPKPRACRRKQRHRKYSMHSARSAPSITPNSTAYTAIAGTQANASSRLPGAAANTWSTATTRPDDSAASGANSRNASTTVRSAIPTAVQLRASRSTFSHHAVIHHDASPAA